MSWRKLSGGREGRVAVTIGSGILAVGVPFRYSGGVAVACADGSHADGVLLDAGAANETKVRAELLTPGDLWEVDVSSQTIAIGVKVAMSGASTVDAGTSTNPAIGRIVNKTVTTADSKAQIEVLGEPATID